MRIKRLEICGFKSFVDRTVLTFNDPITGVVGPNGCGKSNIVDAIRWVMGEQSAKHLRGRAMEDVIFNGSESRGPAGLAEVSITFDTRSLGGDIAPGGVPWGGIGPTDVVVTRRLYRGGDSEYLLGGVPCRLRDIVEFFLGTGVGSKAYAIIEQGRIGFIVSSRPEDRRTLIDEAAGITKYKAKKKIAERRMEATRQHLLRVSDIIGEIETRLRSLKLQAQKAERYKRYKAELKNLELTLATQKHLGLIVETKCLTVDREQVNERLFNETGTLRAEEAVVETERLSLATESAELSQLKEDLFALNNKAQLSAQRAEHYQEEAGMLAGRAEHSRREIEHIDQRVKENAESLLEMETQVGLFDEEAELRSSALEEIERTVAEAKSELAGYRRKMDETVQSASTSKTRYARLEGEIEAARTRVADLNNRFEEVTLEAGQLQERMQEIQGEITRLDESASILKERLFSLDIEKEEAEGRIATLKAEVAKGEIELETLREEAHRRRSRLQSLEEIQSRYESFQRGVRAIMQRTREAAAQLPKDSGDGARNWSSTGVKGLVADIVQPPPELEAALEAVLGEKLGNIIVESHEVGVEAIDFLKQKSEGRSSFIPIALRSDAEMNVDSSSASPSAETALVTGGHWPSGEGVRGPILELIGFDRKYDRVASYLLGDVVVVENLGQALTLWKHSPTSKTLVTLEGEVIDPHGVVTGGSRESAIASVLSQKREMRELEEVVARLEIDYQSALDRHVNNKQQLAANTLALEENRSEFRKIELEDISNRKDLDRLRRELSQLQAKNEQLSTSIETIRKSVEQSNQRAEEGSAQLTSEAEAITEMESTIAELREKVEVGAMKVEELTSEQSAIKVTAAQAVDKKRNAHDLMDRLRREIAESEARKIRLQTESDADSAQSESLKTEAERLRVESLELQEEISEKSRRFSERQGVVEERTGALARREADLKQLRTLVAKLTQELSSLDMRLEQTRMRLQSLDEQIRERYSEVQSVSSLLFEYHLAPLSGVEEDNRIKELRGLVERMGEVNLMAIEESEDLQKRYDFLTSQKSDLESALSQLEAAVEKINKASRRRFREVFDAVNTKFQEVFPNLFGGGKAHLALTDENDMLETGVEIVANPPGKKLMQNIELLSGGEKALTAVSLLFAIFLVKPSPFCVLDEVDAPLDEANVGRFNNAVREMTDRSQFIIVTHNQRTMEIADRLCGITMEESGVSKLVAVNLKGRKRGEDNPEPTPGAMGGGEEPSSQPAMA